MTYDFLNKDNQRSGVVNMWQRCDEKRDVVFLDDENAGACTAFLESGIPKTLLKPVNFSIKDSRRITRRSGVPCACTDIDQYVSELDDDACSVVWLDYMKNTVDVAILRDCIRVAPYVSVTLSLRKISRTSHEENIRKLVKSAGGEVTAYTTYKGASGVMNMMCFNVERRNRSGVVKQGKSMTKRKHAPPLLQLRARDRVVVKWRNLNYTAVVTESSRTHVDVVLDCDGVKKSIPRDRVALNPVTHSAKTLDKMVGKLVYIPRSHWSGDISAYKRVKRCGNRLVFKITRRAQKNDRYSLVAVDAASGRTMKKGEAWTLTYDQAVCRLK